MDENEQKIREQLGKQLGVEFCSEEELEQEQEFRRAERRLRQISVSELILHCQNAAKKMKVKNSNRFLLLNCAFALRQLVDRLAFYEDPKRIS